MLVKAAAAVGATMSIADKVNAQVDALNLNLGGSNQGPPAFHNPFIVFADNRAIPPSESRVNNIYWIDIRDFPDFVLHPITNETDPLNAQMDPATWGLPLRIVWIDTTGNDQGNNFGHIMYRSELGDITQLTSGEANKRHPKIYGNTVVWEGIDDHIYTCDLRSLPCTPQRITSDGAWAEQPNIHNGNNGNNRMIVWHDWRQRQGGGTDIWGWTEERGEFQITDDPERDEYPSVYDGVVVYQKEISFGINELFKWDSENGEQFLNIIDLAYPDLLPMPFSPVIYGDFYAWTDVRHGSDDIYALHPTFGILRITDNNVTLESDPVAFADTIIFRGTDGSGNPAYRGPGTGGPLDLYMATIEPVEPEDIPTVSEWGMLILALLTLTFGTLVYRHRTRLAKPA